MKKAMTLAAAVLMAAVALGAQCAATTKKGTQCKRQASPGSEYCWQHGGTTRAQRAAANSEFVPVRARGGNAADASVAVPAATGRCQGMTKAGTQCKRNAQQGSKFCWQHASMNDGGDAVAVPVARQMESRSEDAGEKATPVAGGRCQATTKSGKQCGRKARSGSKFCWQHDK